MILIALTLNANAGDAEAGKTLYAQYCTTCHGVDGGGDGPAGAALTPKPSNFTEAAFWEGRATEDLKKAISEGGVAVGKSPIMPPWGAVLDEEQVGDVIAHLESLKHAEPAE